MKKNFLFSMLLSPSLLAGTVVHARSGDIESGKVGNGGDGIVGADGKVVMYDLFESNLDATRSLNAFKKRYRRNFALESTLDDLDVFYDFQPAYGEKPEGLHAALTVLLDHVSQHSPTLMQVILDELKQLRWRKAVADLLPNPDTQPFVDLRGQKRVGCARNISMQILYSPSCSGASMRPADKAGLILHEALYSAYRRVFPDIDNSANVRSLVEALFEPDLATPAESGFREPPFAKILKSEGLSSIEDKDQKLRQSYRLSYGWGFERLCNFQSDRLPKALFEFSGLYHVRGRITYTGESGPTAGLVIGSERSWSIGPFDGRTPNSLGAWRLQSIPNYDTGDGSMSLNLQKHDGSSWLRFRFQKGASVATVEGYDERNGHFNGEGSCQPSYAPIQ